MRKYLSVSHSHTMAVASSGRTAMLVFVLIATALFACVANVYAQSGTKPNKEKPEKPDKTKAEQPLELPEFVITGVEALDVPGGAKQSPKLPTKLTTSDLRRFNPLDKVSFALLPQAPLPRLLLPAQERNGFLKGEFGMFITPSIDAGYRAVLGNFDLNANAGATFSNGHLPNADFSDVYGSLKSTYLAPEKFLFFGGSRTDTYVKARHRAYKFFGLLDTTEVPFSRMTFNLSAGVQTVGSFEGWVYDMGADIKYLHFITAALPTQNLVLNGHILGKKTFGEWTFGGKADAQFQNLEVGLTDAYILAPAALAEFRTTNNNLAFQVSGGIQCIQENSTDSIIRGEFLLRPTVTANASFHAAQSLSLHAEFFSGTRMNTISGLVADNPYIFFVNLPRRFEVMYHTPYNIKFYASFQPYQHLAIILGGSVEKNDNTNIFLYNFRRGGILGSWDTTSIQRLFTEATFFPDSNNTLTARINANFSSTIFRGTVPYLAPFEASLEYRRYWLPALSTTLTGVYLGDRTNGGSVGSSERRILPAFADIRLHVEYHFSPQFSIYVRGTNLLNQPIFMWDGYRERGIFAALGAMLTF